MSRRSARRGPWARVAATAALVGSASLGAGVACSGVDATRRARDELASAPSAAWLQRIDWAAAGDEAVRLLSGYLQVKTVNPPGDEAAGALYLQRVLQAEGLESELVPLEPGRASLVARLRARGPNAGTLCLASHLDVVPADAARWRRPEDAYSGRVDEDGMLWGRGALDMKGLGALELATFLWLHRLGVPLGRDVVLVATADEEVDNRGITQLVEHEWARLGCAYMLNEGGLGVRDAIFPGQTLFTISVGEKGNLWLRMTAHGKAGHGSVVRPDTAIARLLEAVSRLRAREAEPAPPAPLYGLLSSAGEQHGGVTSSVLKRRWLVNWLVVGDLMDDPFTAAAITNTIHVTGLRTPEAKPNVVTAEASAVLDCRLLPGVDPLAFLDEVRAAAGDDLELTFETLAAQPGNESPVDDPFYEALARHAVASVPGAAVGPVISVGSTDSILVRPRGVRAYGFSPFVITRDEAGTMHGADERLSVENVHRGLKILLGAVVDFAGVAP